MTSVVNVIAGYTVGRYIQEKGNTYEGLTKLLIAGALLLFAAYCWNLAFPINKKLWTSSFVLHTVGIDCIVISIIIYIINFKQINNWTYFFEVFGRNPLFIYLLSELGAILLWFFKADAKTPLYTWIYKNIFQHAGDYFGAFLFAVSFMLTCWLVGYVLDKKKIYVRV